jgi:hypothetical protein
MSGSKITEDILESALLQSAFFVLRNAFILTRQLTYIVMNPDVKTIKLLFQKSD